MLNIEKHIDNEVLTQKIITLFEYRNFPELFKIGDKTSISKDKLWASLIDLQKSIYYLDAHLEANVQPNAFILNTHWEDIMHNLSPLIPNNVNPSEYLTHIKKYEKHELQLRQGRSPIRLNLEYFYFYKSCDVKLLRRLIYEHLRLTSKIGNQSEWRYFDLVTEVNDDIEDLFEDLDFINGNLFLISLLTIGKQKTYEKFTLFLQHIQVMADKKYRDHNIHQKSIYENTLMQIRATQTLMLQRLESISDNILNDAKIKSCPIFDSEIINV